MGELRVKEDNEAVQRALELKVKEEAALYAAEMSNKWSSDGCSYLGKPVHIYVHDHQTQLGKSRVQAELQAKLASEVELNAKATIRAQVDIQENLLQRELEGSEVVQRALELKVKEDNEAVQRALELKVKQDNEAMQRALDLKVKEEAALYAAEMSNKWS